MKPLVLHRSKHSVSRKNIDAEALKVLYRLHRFGFLAYLVGGSVRDLLLGCKPKDFDIVTNARPNRVKKIFRNSFLIGRRFRLVHIKFKDKIIETATFRRNPEQPENNNGDLLIRRENTFGTPEEDACRRDFTINGLFYNIADFSVIDYVGGLEDLEQRTLRTIGDAAIRFQEDPVRMIRAIRVAGRIGFDISEDCWSAIRTYRNEILKCPPARIIEEIYHLMKYQSASLSMKLFHESGLMETMMPGLAEAWEDEKLKNQTLALLSQLDHLPPSNPFITPPLLLATLFFPAVHQKTNQFKSGEDLRRRVDECFSGFSKRFNLSRRHLDRLTQICLAQRWFDNQTSRRFKPMSFIQRNFFAETLTLATMRMNASPELWNAQREKWLSRIKKAELPRQHKKELISTLQFTPPRQAD